MSGGKGQIINLGAGFDTLYWRLKDAGNSPANFVELDFPSVTAKKCYYIKKQKQLIDRLNTEGKIDALAILVKVFKYKYTFRKIILLCRWRN